MKVRQGTWDSVIAAQVLNSNEYNLPDDLTGATIVDIGAHIGSFVLACAQRGAAQIHCYEADPENYALLVQNLVSDNAADVARAWNTAVVGTTAGVENGVFVRRLNNHDGPHGRNTGHVDVFGVEAPDSVRVPVISIKEVLDSIEQPIDILKLDCEGSEWGIFQGTDFSKVQRIVAELHAMGAGAVDFDKLTDTYLDLLRGQGFHIITAKKTSAETAFIDMNRTASAVEVLSKPKLLWTGSINPASGCGKVTNNICSRLVSRGWDVEILGVDYSGDPHSQPYRIWTLDQSNVQNMHRKLIRVIDSVKPSLMILHEDYWNVAVYLDHFSMLNLWVPTIGYIAVDSENVKPDFMKQLGQLKHAIMHTEFGKSELLKGGYSGKVSVAHHGVDSQVFDLYDKADCRKGLESKKINIDPMDMFIWGVVGRNQQRKRLDLSIAYFARWWRDADQPKNAFLHLHTNWDGDYDLTQITDYCGVRGQIIATTDQQLATTEMPALYNAFDVLISTADSESFCLPILEAMACGTPVICSAQAVKSWAVDAVHYVEPTQYTYHTSRINARRWLASEDDFVAAMQMLYTSPERREELSKRGREFAIGLTWDKTVDEFERVIRQVLTRQQEASKVDALAEFN